MTMPAMVSWLSVIWEWLSIMIPITHTSLNSPIWLMRLRFKISIPFVASNFQAIIIAIMRADSLGPVGWWLTSWTQKKVRNNLHASDNHELHCWS
jgi:hypothetical protein